MPVLVQPPKPRKAQEDRLYKYFTPPELRYQKMLRTKIKQQQLDYLAA